MKAGPPLRGSAFVLSKGADTGPSQCHSAVMHRASRPPGRGARLVTRLFVVACVLVLTLASDVVERWPWQIGDRSGFRSVPGGFTPP